MDFIIEGAIKEGGMSFMGAINALKEGKFVRRPSWDKDSYWILGKDGSICWKDGRTAHVHINQVEAMDWEIWTDKRVKCIYCKQPIHIDHFGGIKKEGLFCDSPVCLSALLREQEEAEAQTQAK